MRKPSNPTAKERKFKVLCREVIDGILQLPKDCDLMEVVAIFKGLKCKPMEKSDVFWELDNKPGHYARYQEWHPALRSCRNSIKHGTALFDTFKE